MPAAVIPAVIGAATSIYSAKQQKKAASSAASQLSALAQPDLEAQQYGLAGMKRLLDTNLMPAVGADSAALKTAHNENIFDINQTEQTAKKQSANTWADIGNPSASRGESFRIGMTAAQSRNKENASYGLSQQDYHNAAVQQAMSALGLMTSQGAQGTQLASQAIDTNLAGESAMNSGIANLGGTIFGYALDKYGNLTKKPAAKTNPYSSSSPVPDPGN